MTIDELKDRQSVQQFLLGILSGEEVGVKLDNVQEILKEHFDVLYRDELAVKSLQMLFFENAVETAIQEAGKNVDDIKNIISNHETLNQTTNLVADKLEIAA